MRCALAATFRQAFPNLNFWGTAAGTPSRAPERLTGSETGYNASN
jgi:hypothetical protein